MSVREFIGAGEGIAEGGLLAHGLAVLEQTGIRLDLDVPMSGLLRAEQALADVLREMMAQRGCGILYVSHRVDEVLSLVDRILVMRDGRIVRGHSPREASTGDVVYSKFERRLSEPQRPGEAVEAERDAHRADQPRHRGAARVLRDVGARPVVPPHPRDARRPPGLPAGELRGHRGHPHVRRHRRIGASGSGRRAATSA
ncbi:hypothetical protein [Kocuria sp. SL71]|uniref:hypothetical protein n=1 Tax=Kocuria sp. SL71 TaxID=2995151 RepID=UPI0022769552|nr:hypothetical protein [Kocuria sp. SL71]MCY1684482.1 hypothetical protein [Kocuria sp. SL71]